MQFIEVKIIANAGSADLLCDLLAPFAQDNSVVQEQLGNPDDLSPTAMLPDTALKFWYSQDQDSADFRQQINSVSAQAGCDPATFTSLDSIDWTTEWRKNYRPILAGNTFVILPPWEDNPDPQRVPIRIDPGIAFGTGQHETTRLCIAQLEKLVEPNMRILDLGSGSAILSVAAKHLGAGYIAAVEIDGDAVRSAAENLRLNEITDTVELFTGSLETVAGQQWDLIVANILAVILIKLITENDLLNQVKPGGRIIFSGIIDQQLDRFSHIIKQSDCQIEQIAAEGEWVAVTVYRPL